MKYRLSGACVAMMLAHAAPAWAVPDPARPPCPPDHSRAEDYYQRGITDQISLLRGSAYDMVSPDLVKTFESTKCLGDYYAALSGAQQSGVNAGSQAVSIAAIGALLSGSSVIWQEALGYGALTPVLISQISALEPKRDLFSGARVGIDRISERYLTIHEAGGALAKNLSAREGETVSSGCDWSPGAAAATEVTAAARLAAYCARLRRANAELAVLVQDYETLKPSLARHYATDVLLHAQNVTQRHRELLFTPSETLSAILASPFRAADRLLTGEDGQKALEQLKTQQAFEGLNQTMTPLAHRLTGVTTDLGTFEPLSAAEQTNANALDAWNAIDRDRLQVIRDLAIARALIAAAERTQLRYDYSSASRIVTITLDKPAPSPGT